MIVYTHIYISFTFEKYVYIKKYIYTTFANLLIEKSVNWFAIAKKVTITREEERNFKKSICIYA